MAVAPEAIGVGASIPQLDAASILGLQLMQRPSLLVPVVSTGVSRMLVGGTGILAGAVFRNQSDSATSIAYLSASSANPAAANNVTLPAGGPGITTYVTGFEITGDGATAGSIITVTLTGVLGGTATYFLTIPAGIGTAITPLSIEFTAPGFPASAANVAITLNVPSFGAGNTNAAVVIRGYQQTLAAPVGPGTPGPVGIAYLFDGLDANGDELAAILIPAGGFWQQALGPHGPVFRRGLFLNMSFGTIRGAVYVKI